MTENSSGQHEADDAVEGPGPSVNYLRSGEGSAIVVGHGGKATVTNVYGTRLPAIEELPAPPAPESAWLMTQPSRLLDARNLYDLPKLAVLRGLTWWHGWRSEGKDPRLARVLSVATQAGAKQAASAEAKLHHVA